MVVAITASLNRNEKSNSVDWRFVTLTIKFPFRTKVAHIKLKKLYPSIQT